MKHWMKTIGAALLIVLAACNQKGDLPTAPPSAPTSLSATATSNTSVSLSWSAVAGATGYSLQRRTGSGSYADLPGATNLTATTYADATVQLASNAYTYRVAALNANGKSGYTESNTVTSPGSPQPPAAPTNFKVSGATASSLTLSWTAPAGVTGYVLQRSTDNSSFTPLSPAPAGSATTYTDNGLNVGTNYFYRLFATNANGQSPAAATSGTTQGSGSAPGSPTGFSASAVTGTSTVVTLTWNAPTSGGTVSSYTLERDTGSGFAPLANLPAGTLKYADLSANALSNGVSANYRLTAVGAGGPGTPVTASAGGLPALCNSGVLDSTNVGSKGCFGSPFQWPLVATFGGLMPDGTFLAWYGTDPSGNDKTKDYLDLTKHASTVAVYWNPAKGRNIDLSNPAGSAFVSANNGRTDLFCAGQVIGKDGKFYVAGGGLGNSPDGSWTPGHYHTNIYDWRSQSWSAGPNMKPDPNYPQPPLQPNGALGTSGVGGRWYPSVITLSSGKLLVIGGLGYYNQPGGGDMPGNPTSSPRPTPTGGDNLIPEIWDTDSSTTTQLLGARLTNLTGVYDHYYPWVFQDPFRSNQVYLAGGGYAVGYLSLNGGQTDGSWVNTQALSTWRNYGSAAMYQPGKILLVGGGGENDFTQPTGGVPNSSEKSAARITLNPSNNSQTVESLPDMKWRRTHTDATILPDGKVWVNGGNTNGANWNISAAVYESELWNPAKSAFTPAAVAQQPRIYHSTATLMPDGTVLTVGGGGNGNDDTKGSPDCTAFSPSGVPTAGLTCGINQFNGEIYYPPYLFKGGKLAPRPSILSVSAPSGSDGQGNPKFRAGDANITITTDQPATSLDQARVTFLKLGSATHAFNTGQNFNELSVTARSGSTLTVSAPSTYNYAPPGYYMLFVLNDDGVPSVAKIVYMSL